MRFNNKEPSNRIHLRNYNRSSRKSFIENKPLLNKDWITNSCKRKRKIAIWHPKLTSFKMKFRDWKKLLLWTLEIVRSQPWKAAFRPINKMLSRDNKISIIWSQKSKIWSQIMHNSWMKHTNRAKLIKIRLIKKR